MGPASAGDPRSEAHPFAFPKSARLRTPGEFARVQKGGRTLDLGPLVFRAAPRPVVPVDAPPAQTCARLGLAISRRVGNAVQRNHVKRRVREAFRHRQARLGGLDLVVTGRPAAAALAQGDVDRLFEVLLDRLGR